MNDPINRREFARVSGLGIAGAFLLPRTASVQEDPMLTVIDAQLAKPLDAGHRQIAGAWLANRAKIYELRKPLTLQDGSEPCTVFQPRAAKP